MGHTHHWAQAMDPRLMALEEENKAFVKKYTPKNTTEAYEGQLKFFDAYLQEEGLQDLASDPVVLCNVLIRKQKAGAAHNTCKLLRSAVGSRFKHAKQNPSDSMKVTEVMSRIKAATPPKKEYREVPRALLWRVAAAAEQEVAAAIIAGRSLAAFRALRDKTLMLSSFATWSRQKSLMDLYQGDVVLEGQAGKQRLHFKFVGHADDEFSFGPKNHQGEQHECIVGHCKDRTLDLVESMVRYKAMEALVLLERGQFATPKWMFYNLINHPSHFGNKLSPSTANSMFKKRLVALADPALELKGLTFYGIKFGGVSAARRAGASAEARKKHGGWKSDAHRGYDVLNEEEMLAVTTNI